MITRFAYSSLEHMIVLCVGMSKAPPVLYFEGRATEGREMDGRGMGKRPRVEGGKTDEGERDGRET